MVEAWQGVHLPFARWYPLTPSLCFCATNFNKGFVFRHCYKNKCIWTLKLWSVTVLFLVSYYCPMDGQWALKVFRNHKFAVLGSGFLTFTRCKCLTWLRWCWIFSSAFQKSLPIDENWKVQYQEYLANIYILLQQTKWSRSKTNTLLHFHQGKNDNCL